MYEICLGELNFFELFYQMHYSVHVKSIEVS